jgi:hypothetical protein
VPRSHCGRDNIELREERPHQRARGDRAELRQRLGREATAVIELSYLDPESQQRLLSARGNAPGAPAQHAKGVTW